VPDLKAIMKLSRSFLEENVSWWARRHYKVCGQCSLRSAHGPDVEIVNLLDVGQ
jgi:hypothetical protein